MDNKIILENEKIIENAMTVILSAGDARLLLSDALNQVSEGEYDIARQKLITGKSELSNAHRTHYSAPHCQDRNLTKIS